MRGLVTDYVISLPMRGLQKTHGEWTSNKHANRQTCPLYEKLKRVVLILHIYVLIYSFLC